MFRLAAKLVLPLLLTSAACAQLPSLSSHYTFVTLDYPNAAVTYPLGINNNRVVAGTFFDYTGVSHGFTWNKGAFTQIDYPGTFIGTSAGGINDRGDIAGTFYDNSGFQHGYTLAAPAWCAVPTATGACAPVFKQIDFPGATQTQGIVFELGPGLGTAGIGINNNSLITGMFATSGLYSDGFISRNGQFLAIDNPNSTHTAGNGTKCFSASNLNVDACDYLSQAYEGAPVITHGFLRKESTFTPIDVPGVDVYGFGTQISGVNNANTAVGAYFDYTGLNALLWSAGNYFSINFPGMPYNEAHSISDKGAITGAYATDPYGVDVHGFLAFPK